MAQIAGSQLSQITPNGVLRGAEFDGQIGGHHAAGFSQAAQYQLLTLFR
jgi:hypothetical protein